MDTSAKIDFAAYLNVKNALSPAFRADGQELLFLSDITGTHQIWSVKTGDGSSWPDQLTFYDERVTGLHADPAGERFLFSRDRGGDEQDQFYLLEGTAAEGVSITTLLETPEYKNNFGAWRKDGGAFCFSSNRRHPAFFDVFTQEPGGEPVLVYEASASLYPLDWSHDGRYLLITRANTNMDSDLLLLDLYAPGAAPRHLTPHPGQARYEAAVFSPDDTTLYLLTDQGRDFIGLARLDLGSGELTFLNETSWDAESLSLSPDGTRLAYVLNEEGYTRIFWRDLSNEPAQPHEREIGGLPRGTAAELVWSPDGTRLAFSFHGPTHNANIWLYTLATGDLRQVTFSAPGGLSPQSFVMPELIHYPTFDGRQIPALQFLPAGAKGDASIPFIVFVHGGPEGQTRFIWNGIIQYFVRAGYGVLAPNVRGSSGYGKHYLSLDDVRKRMDSVADLKAAAEWLTGQGVCDPRRIAVYGGSYGGFMVLSALTIYPDLWAAGVDIVGIANLITFLENTSAYRRKLRTPEYGDPDTDRDFLIEISPIHKIDRIQAPLLVIHGARDPRVPVGEAEQMVAALTARHHPVEYHVFEDEGHGITKLKNKLVVYPAVARFLDQHLKTL